MIRKIISGIAALTLLCRAVCHAEDLSLYLNGRAVNVVESNESIDIYARYSMEGKASEYVIPNTQITYEEAFPRGIKDMWEGEYHGKPVKVNLEKVDAADENEKIKVKFDIVHGTESFSCASVGYDKNIWIYSGDGRDVTNIFYSYSWYTYAAGHEFGHAALSLPDVYADDKLKDCLATPMNNHDTLRAQEVDYYMLLTHRTWELDGLYQYSDDMDSISKYLTH